MGAMQNTPTVEAALTTLAKIEKLGASAWDLDDDNGNTDESQWACVASLDGFTFLVDRAGVTILDEDDEEIATLYDNESETILRVASDVGDVFDEAIREMWGEYQHDRAIQETQDWLIRQL